jgi:hypothetical protein
VYNVLRDAGFSIYNARETVEEYAGKYLGHWSILKNLPAEAKDESKAIGGKASDEARKERRLEQESKEKIYPHRIVLAEEVVTQIVKLRLKFVRSIEIEEVAPGDIRVLTVEP